jgi:hypothetical protein
MYFNTDHDNEEYLQPITPVLKCEEGPIEAIFTLFIVSYRIDQIKSITSVIQSTMRGWPRSGIVNVSMGVVNLCTSGTKCFQKQLINSRQFTQSWKEGKNKRETMRQRTSILRNDGVISTVVASQAVTEMSESILRQNSTMSIMGAQELCHQCHFLHKREFHHPVWYVFH